ncbi:hypothetical protein EYC84_007056 [Monilinia fructicola]|uniref:Uncharacterized protein n=1 Tax=Monilinia fructicola TaxID=38448 RepID=A0A5M9KAB8_MONFR|nr:hypothetical protein EYC84_007056 [Monilinia fructicola]
MPGGSIICVTNDEYLLTSHLPHQEFEKPSQYIIIPSCLLSSAQNSPLFPSATTFIFSTKTVRISLKRTLPMANPGLKTPLHRQRWKLCWFRNHCLLCRQGCQLFKGTYGMFLT